MSALDQYTGEVWRDNRISLDYFATAFIPANSLLLIENAFQAPFHVVATAISKDRQLFESISAQDKPKFVPVFDRTLSQNELFTRYGVDMVYEGCVGMREVDGKEYLNLVPISSGIPGGSEWNSDYNVIISCVAPFTVILELRVDAAFYAIFSYQDIHPGDVLRTHYNGRRKDLLALSSRLLEDHESKIDFLIKNYMCCQTFQHTLRCQYLAVQHGVYSSEQKEICVTQRFLKCSDRGDVRDKLERVMRDFDSKMYRGLYGNREDKDAVLRVRCLCASHIDDMMRMKYFFAMLDSTCKQLTTSVDFQVIVRMWISPELRASFDVRMDAIRKMTIEYGIKCPLVIFSNEPCSQFRHLSELVRFAKDDTWLMFTDDDDIWHPLRLQQYCILMQAAHAHGQLDITYVQAGAHYCTLRDMSSDIFASTHEHVDVALKSGKLKMVHDVKIPEFWSMATRGKFARLFFQRIDDDLLDHGLCDRLFARFLALNKLKCIALTSKEFIDNNMPGFWNVMYRRNVLRGDVVHYREQALKHAPTNDLVKFEKLCTQKGVLAGNSRMIFYNVVVSVASCASKKGDGHNIVSLTFPHLRGKEKNKMEILIDGLLDNCKYLNRFRNIPALTAKDV